MRIRITAIVMEYVINIIMIMIMFLVTIKEASLVNIYWRMIISVFTKTLLLKRFSLTLLPLKKQEYVFSFCAFKNRFIREPL